MDKVQDMNFWSLTKNYINQLNVLSSGSLKNTQNSFDRGTTSIKFPIFLFESQNLLCFDNFLSQQQNINHQTYSNQLRQIKIISQNHQFLFQIALISPIDKDFNRINFHVIPPQFLIGHQLYYPGAQLIKPLSQTLLYKAQGLTLTLRNIQVQVFKSRDSSSSQTYDINSNNGFNFSIFAMLINLVELVLGQNKLPKRAVQEIRQLLKENKHFLQTIKDLKQIIEVNNVFQNVIQQKLQQLDYKLSLKQKRKPQKMEQSAELPKIQAHSVQSFFLGFQEMNSKLQQISVPIVFNSSNCFQQTIILFSQKLFLAKCLLKTRTIQIFGKKTVPQKQKSRFEGSSIRGNSFSIMKKFKTQVQPKP